MNPSIVKQLVGGRNPISVVSIEHIEAHVELVPWSGGRFGVILDGIAVGVFDERGGDTAEDQFPMTVKGIRVCLSDGQGTFARRLSERVGEHGGLTYVTEEKKNADNTPVFVVTCSVSELSQRRGFGKASSEFEARELASQDLLLSLARSGVIAMRAFERQLRVLPRNETLFAVTQELALPFGQTLLLYYEDAERLTIGQVLAYSEYPFQWVGDVLTNGEVSLPRNKPRAQEWRLYAQYGIRSVKAPVWLKFLHLLEKKFLNELAPSLEEAKRRLPKKNN